MFFPFLFFLYNLYGIIFEEKKIDNYLIKYFKTHPKFTLKYSINEKKIRFYNVNDKIMVSSNNGWLESSNGKDIEQLYIPVSEIKIKRKVAFNGEIFAISKGKEFCGSDLIAELYIPAYIYNIVFVKNY